jgi:polyhydroxybutyrate depolymerase
MKNFEHYLSMILRCLLMLSITSCSGVAATPIPTIIPTPTATISPTATASPIQAGDSQRKLTVNGLERTYLLHIPPGLDSIHPVPVVLAFHGFGEQPADMQRFTGFTEIADKSGFLIVYPEGMALSWNADICCGYAFDNKIDEASFVRQIVSDLGTIAKVDPKRIYATGFSMGGPLVYKLACQMSDILAGIAPVAGVLAYSPCQPQEPVSVMHIHGGADIKVPYAGGGALHLPPVEQGISTWAKLDGCDNSPKVEKLQNIITHTSYTSCQAGTGVELYVVEPAGHMWPTKYIWPASQVIWDFFAAHPKP